MGFVAKNLAPKREQGKDDGEYLWSVIQHVNRIDGVVEPSEAMLAEAFCRTIPQLRAGRSNASPLHTRAGLVDQLARIEDRGLCRQLYVVALEAALASGDVNTSEDQYLEHVAKALRIDDDFARRAIEIVGYKYARGT